MSISILTIGKVAISLRTLAKDCPLKKMAKNEFDMALYILSNANIETAFREAINRALGHLESAYANFPITTWDIWDKDTALWGKKNFANSICLHIAILHYMLGNNNTAKKWLLENLDNMGSIEFPKNILGSLSMNVESDFYKAIAGKEYTRIENLIQQSEYNWDRVYDHDPDDFLMGGIYSG